MKKILLSTFTILSFAFYGVYQRTLGSHSDPNQTQPTPTIPGQGIPSPSVQNQDNPTPTIPNQITPTPSIFNTPKISTPQVKRTNTYKDGTYTGKVADASYGDIQVQVVISGGRITNVTFLQYPNDRENSIRINSYAMPILKQEAIQAQSAKVDIVSGATDSSLAFIESLQSALSNAL